jgi:UDP-N-acetylmuramoylalanine--D-glutamate ligase
VTEPPRRPPLPPGPFLVAGLARSGIAAGLALRERGEEVLGTDARPLRDAERALLAVAGIPVEAPGDGLALLERCRTVIKSPGVPQDVALLNAARAAGHVVVGELEIAWRLLIGQPFLAVTGSNGKTTTVELLGAMHRAQGAPVTVAGNVGTALSSLVGKVAPGTTVVCEASSFQLEDATEFAPEVGVLLNITSDHLDRHGTLDAYRAAKLRMFARQPASAVAVLPESFADADADVGGCGRRVFFGSGPIAHVRERDGALWWHGERLLAVDAIRLPGRHNVENAMAASAAALASGLSPDAVATALQEFAGVEHRLEQVSSDETVSYVNDSKATNVASAVVGISSYRQGVHAILGGRGKGEDYRSLRPAVARSCRAVYLIGETADEIAAALADAGVPLHACGDLEHAVAAARAAARPGDVVLLSPACASFDQYSSYEERGAHFRRLVRPVT